MQKYSAEYLLFFSVGIGFSGVFTVALLLDDRERLGLRLLLDFSLVGNLVGIFLFGEPGDPFRSFRTKVLMFSIKYFYFK